jgi:hypothetical protein
MATLTLDAVDAEELAEILEYFLERIDLQGRDATELLSDPGLYGRDDLRSDLTRLIERLRNSPLSP